ncbi:MAG TPA: AAA family ATPase [Candidatus Nanopelagicales bacterium]|nr:AAA family ATPase [Candidatus Nanopelagicales bacterium]
MDSGHVEAGRWPWTVPAIAQLAERGVDLDAGITVIIGPNGAGKSTVVEAIAAAWGRLMSSHRQDWLQQAVASPSDEDSALFRSLRLQTTTGGANGGLFLRAERLHAQAASFTQRGRWSERVGPTPLLELSHGEGFLAVLRGMSDEPGLYVLDEPESALSFDSSLALLQIMVDMRSAGSQIVLATHSPVLAAVPGARLLQLDESGIEDVAYDDADLVTSWRAFLAAPDRYLRHLT